MALSMFSLCGVGGVALCLVASGLSGQDLSTRAWDLEKHGDASQAERLLRQSAASAPNDPVTQRAYAEFLERHGSPETRAAYEKLAAALERSGSATDRAAAQHRAGGSRFAVG